MSANEEEVDQEAQASSPANTMSSDPLAMALSERATSRVKASDVPENEEAETKKEKEKDSEPAAEKPKEVVKKDAPKKEKEVSKKDKIPAEDDDDDEEEEQPEHVQILEKTKKSLSDTQKWGHGINRKLKAAERLLDEALEAGGISEDQFNSFKEALQSDHPEPKEEKGSTGSPLNELIDAASEKVEDLRDLIGEDEAFDKKIAAFDFFMKNASAEERKETYEELRDLKGSPAKLAKKMFSIGEQFYEEFYKDFDESLGLRGLIQAKNRQVESKQKAIDKLKKELSQYKDHDKPTNRISELGLDVRTGEPQKWDDPLAQALAERSRRVVRR